MHHFRKVICSLLAVFAVLQVLLVPVSATETEIPTTETVRVQYESIPLYYQTDYPDVRYGNGTVATSGCSITALAMVATYLTGHEYRPDELALWFGGRAENNMARLEAGSDALQLPYEKNTNWHTSLKALQEGKIVIALMGEASIFTNSQHFIVLTGMTEDGKIMVNDPYQPNYEFWQLKRAFVEGFDEDDICCGYSGGWVYDPAAMPEEPFIYEPPAEEAPVNTIHDVPLYFQTDYDDVRYGSGTVATSGCSITSLAMVATYLTGYEYTPDQLARYFGGRAENNMARLEAGSEALQLPYEKNTNWHTSFQALKEGKIVIALMNANSAFTNSQHFIVLTGISNEGKILVNDSYAPNYEHWDLKNGFANGFEDYEIWCGYEGGWVYDPAAMPEEPFFYWEDTPKRPAYRYTGIDLTTEEVELLARVVWVESRGESAEGQQAVAEIVLNRLHSGEFGSSLESVIFAEGQFRSVPYLKDAEPGQAQYEAIENALYGPYILPTDVYHFATFRVNENVWGKIGGHIFCYESN